MNALQKCVYIILAIAFRVSLLLPVQRAPWLTACWRVGLSAWICYSAYRVLSWRAYGVDTSVSGLVSTALFLCDTLCALVIALEATLKQRTYCKLQDLLRTLDMLLAKYLDMHAEPAGSIRFVLLAMGTDTVFVAWQMWITVFVYDSPLYWWALPAIQVIRMRFVQVGVLTIELNLRARSIKRALRRLAGHNKPKSKYGFDIWRPYAAWELEQLNVLRLIYGYLCRAYEYMDECFGYSLVWILMTTLFVFVRHFFWCFHMVRNEYVVGKLLFNMTIMCAIGVKFLLLLGSADATEIYGHQIGCNICKLVKPLGNKRFNDLVTHFSLQTLHQPLFITAKSFFNLNLNLLASMIAAIATYLVVLIQFMLAEKVDTSVYPTTSMTSNSSTVPPLV